MSKDKWVRRFCVDETARHKNGFTIYKITSVLFPLESPETVTVISVWKRYSDVQKLHASIKALHAGLHLKGTFPPLPRFSYFKRFQKEVIEERAKVIKSVLEFIAEHKLLFTSTDFVNFLQTGYPEPEDSTSGVINAIRSSLHLPIEETPPLEYQTSDDDSRSPQHSANRQPQSMDEPDFVSQIPIYESSDIELREERDSRSPAPLTHADSFESINSLLSSCSDMYSEVEKVTVQQTKPLVKKNVLPDLIIFDAPSTSQFDDYHTMKNEDTVSLSSTNQNSEYSASIASTNQRSEYSASTNQQSEISKDYTRSNSRVSCKSGLSLSNLASVECKTKTEDSYVFEAGYMLNLAARYEDMEEYSRAFECYKAGIEKMLIGVQTDTDHHRRALIKEKTNKYLSHAERIYKSHLVDAEQSLSPAHSPPRHCLPATMLRRPPAHLALYRVLAVLGAGSTLVLQRGEQACYAMKVIQKIPNNLTEFDEYFLQNTNETRQPVLPTDIPYMVPLHAYVETKDLIFLILGYAPGEKLFDYIKNYAKSTPNTPAREVNLENVFSEPKTKKSEENESVKAKSNRMDTENDFADVNIQTIDENELPALKVEGLDLQNENLDTSIIELKTDYDRDKDEVISILDRIEMNDTSNNNKTEKSKSIDKMDTTELVKNSQNLLKNLDKVLSEVRVNKSVEVEDVKVISESEEKVERVLESVEKKIESPKSNRSLREADVAALPPGAVCAWAAQILTALHSLHNAGVVCRDLNPSNILLGDGGQIILTYFVSYPGIEMSLSKLRATDDVNMYIAPELYRYTYVEERDEYMERVCDFWSFGAIMYELICGMPLSELHRSVFTPHTILQFPGAIPVEAQSLLTQLLTYEPSERLGGGKDGVDEIKRHPYFKHVDWQLVYDDWKVPG